MTTPALPFFLPLLQFEGMEGNQILDYFNNLYFRYGGFGVLLIVILFLLRLLIRSAVNKRVKSIHADGMGFMDVEQMRKKGLITEEEYKGVRKRLAERQLKQMKEQEESKKTVELLHAVEMNPELARTLIPIESKPNPPSLQSAAIKSPPSPSSSNPSHSPSPSSPPPPTFSTPSTAEQSSEIVTPGDPLSDPRYLKKIAPSPASTEKSKKSKDLEDLFAKGLISREEYNRLATLYEKM